MNISLSQENALRLKLALEELASDGDLAYAALICASGAIVQSVGTPPTASSAEEIAALGTGALFAARALGERLGQTEEEGLLREDSDHSFYLHPLRNDFMLLSLGNAGVGAGLVRISSRLHLPRLEALCGKIGWSENRGERGAHPVRWEDFERASTTDVAGGKDGKLGGFHRLYPGDIDVLPSLSTGAAAGSSGENPFDGIFSSNVLGDGRRE